MLEWFHGYRRMRLAIGLVVLLCVSFVQSCSELQHTIWGVTQTALITRVQPSSYGGEKSWLTLAFTDEDGHAKAVKRTVADRHGPFAVEQEVEVIYLRGAPERAKLVAERSFIWPLIMFGMIAVIVIWSVVTWRRMEAGKF